jgi:pyruvate dehydrogenase E1 component
MAVIVDHGMREMLVEQRDCFYYVTLMNDNYAQPDLPAGVEAHVVRGCYKFKRFLARTGIGEATHVPPSVTLMGSGAILIEVVKAAAELAGEGIHCDVYSVTSWSELARDGRACEQRMLAGKTSEPAQHGSAAERHAPVPFVEQQLAGGEGPIVAASDYVRAVPEAIRAFIPPGRRYLTLGTDGFGRSDTRAALREFFGVDAAHIVRAAKRALSLRA